MKTEFDQEMPEEIYRAHPGLNYSLLKKMIDGPEYFQHYVDSGQVETNSMRLGTATHCALLEPERFESSYAQWTAVTDSGKRASRRGKKWDEFLEVATAEGLKVISEEEYDQALGIAASVRSHREAARYLETGSGEVSFFWKNVALEGETDADGLYHNIVLSQSKGRIDWYHERGGVIYNVGLKTTANPDPAKFCRLATDLGYDIQWAYYEDGIAQLVPEMEVRTVEIVVSSSAPHVVCVYEIPKEVIRVGRAAYLDATLRLRQCIKNNDWPTSYPEPVQFAYPYYSEQAEKAYNNK